MIRSKRHPGLDPGSIQFLNYGSSIKSGMTFCIYVTLTLLSSLLLPSDAQAQPYAKSLVDTLSSPHFAGRGDQDDAAGQR